MIVLNEKWLISTSNIEFNIDKWAPGEPLWITGSSGDGKSTLSREYANKYNAILCHTDFLLCRIGWPKEKWERRYNDKIFEDDYLSKEYIQKYNDKLPFLYNGVEKRWPTKDEMRPYFLDFFNWIYKKSNSYEYRNSLIIIEGCDITLIDPEIMAQRPLIIMGTSRINALFRRIKRDINKNKEDDTIIKIIFDNIRKYNYAAKDLDDEKDKFIKSIKGIK